MKKLELFFVFIFHVLFSRHIFTSSGFIREASLWVFALVVYNKNTVQIPIPTRYTENEGGNRRPMG